MDTPAPAPDVVSGSSPAPSAPATGQAILDGMSEAESRDWQLTDTIPDRFTKTDKAAPSPATTKPVSSPDMPVDQAAATAATDPPASEPGTPRETGHKGNAETRIRDLARADRANREEIARLQGQLEALSRGTPNTDARPGSSPATVPPSDVERYLAMPDAPQEENFASIAQFTAAMGLFVADKRFEERQAHAQQDAAMHGQVESVRAMGTAAAARIQEYEKTDPTFSASVDPDLIAIQPASVVRLAGQTVGPQHILAENILKSDHTAPLLQHFSTEEGKAEWGRLLMLSYADLQRAFGRIEGRFERGAATPTDATPAPKNRSTAPKPVTTLGSTPSEAIDPSLAALQRKDYVAFEAAENARDLAALTR